MDDASVAVWILSLKINQLVFQKEDCKVCMLYIFYILYQYKKYRQVYTGYTGIYNSQF